MAYLPHAQSNDTKEPSGAKKISVGFLSLVKKISRLLKRTQRKVVTAKVKKDISRLERERNKEHAELLRQRRFYEHLLRRGNDTRASISVEGSNIKPQKLITEIKANKIVHSDDIKTPNVDQVPHANEKKIEAPQTTEPKKVLPEVPIYHQGLTEDNYALIKKIEPKPEKIEQVKVDKLPAASANEKISHEPVVEKIEKVNLMPEKNSISLFQRIKNSLKASSVARKLAAEKKAEAALQAEINKKSLNLLNINQAPELPSNQTTVNQPEPKSELVTPPVPTPAPLKLESKPEPKSEPRLEHRAEPKPEPKLEPVSVPEVTVASQTLVEPIPVPKPEPVVKEVPKPIHSLLDGFKNKITNSKSPKIEAPLFKSAAKVFTVSSLVKKLAKERETAEATKNKNDVESRFWQPYNGIKANLIKDQGLIFFNWRHKILILILSLILCCLVVSLAYVGLFIWQKEKIDANRVALSNFKAIENEVKKSEDELKEITVFNNKLNMVSFILSNHVYWTNLLTFLENNTLKDVYFESFTGDLSGKYTVPAVARNLDAISFQLEVMKAYNLMKSVQYSAAQSDTTVKDAPATVKFNLEMSLDPKIFIKK